MDSDLSPWHNPWGAQQVVQALEDRLGTRIEPSCVGVRCADESLAPHELETPD
jgi:hypothetical protein